MDKNFIEKVKENIALYTNNQPPTQTSLEASIDADNSSIFSHWTTWIVIILILAFLGFNVFVYLAKGTQDISIFFSKILGFLGIATQQTVDVTSTGIEGTATQIADSAHLASQKITPEEETEKNKKYEKDPLSIALNDASHTQNQYKQYHGKADYEADNSYSSVQAKSSGAGWCYIGEDSGYRTCAQVGEADKCMSGNIFPTHEICVNPSLRV